TLSSAYNALAAVTWHDFIQPRVKLSEEKAVLTTKCIAAAYGLLSISVAFLSGTLPSIVQDHVSNQNNSMSSVLEYCERTYIGVLFGRNPTRRVPPFYLSLWSCRERVVDELPKTNNSEEA
ncbi:sodium-coupled monocarboxylate transporter 2 isoform X2, partial [Ixodes scapularis]